MNVLQTQLTAHQRPPRMKTRGLTRSTKRRPGESSPHTGQSYLWSPSKQERAPSLWRSTCNIQPTHKSASYWMRPSRQKTWIMHGCSGRSDSALTGKPCMHACMHSGQHSSSANASHVVDSSGKCGMAVCHMVQRGLEDYIKVSPQRQHVLTCPSLLLS